MSKTASLIGKDDGDVGLKVGRRTSWREWAVSKARREAWLRMVVSKLGDVKVMLRMCGALGESRMRKVCGMGVVLEVMVCMVEIKAGIRVAGTRCACAEGTAFAMR